MVPKAPVVQKHTSCTPGATTRAPVIEWSVSANQKLVGSSWTVCGVYFWLSAHGPVLPHCGLGHANHWTRPTHTHIEDHNPIRLVLTHWHTTQRLHAATEGSYHLPLELLFLPEAHKSFDIFRSAAFTPQTQHSVHATNICQRVSRKANPVKMKSCTFFHF